MARSSAHSSAVPFEDKRTASYSFHMGRVLLAAAFLINGLYGLMESKKAKHDFHRCYHVVIERFFGGSDLEPTEESLAQTYVFFNCVFNVQKMLMVALSFILVQGHKRNAACTMGICLVLCDMIFFTNPIG